MQPKSKRGGKRPGSGRKAGTRNKASVALKDMAGLYSSEAIETLVAVMRDPETPPAVRMQAADKLLDRSHGKPATHIEKPEANVTFIDYEKSRQITIDAIAEAEKQHREMIEGRFERLGIDKMYQGD